MEFEEARACLNGWCNVVVGADASTNRRQELKPREEASSLAWWLEPGKSPDWRNPRCVAYLAAYVEISGRAMPLAGIALADGFMHPDRAVMRALYENDCVTVRDNAFVLTEKGEALIAPWLKVDHATGTPVRSVDRGA